MGRRGGLQSVNKAEEAASTTDFLAGGGGRGEKKKPFSEFPPVPPTQTPVEKRRRPVYEDRGKKGGGPGQ